jgi:glycerol-1-phosphate dehydrogenase [NAD(P)+]
MTDWNIMTDTIIEKDWLKRAPLDIAKYLECPPHLALVWDTNTYEAIGKSLHEVLQPFFKLHVIDLGRSPVATEKAALEIKEKASKSQAIVAVGSGTINDLCKYAAMQGNIPYFACATAPSMNGYNSANASLYFGKAKRSVLAEPPRAVFADLDVLCNAPRQLIRAGMGDVLCRSTVQADWLLSHLLLDTPYDAALFKRLVPMETELLAQPRLISDRDPMFVRLLMRMLFTSGESMTKVGSSAPASQGEHMIAHTYGLFFGENNSYHSYHGEQVAVTTVTMAQIQEKILIKKPKLREMAEKPERFMQLFGRDEGEYIYEEYRKKALSAEQAQSINERLDKEWPEIKRRMEAVRITKSKLESALKLANCPIHPSNINWPKERYEHAVTHAHLTRNRFTFLDLASMDRRLRVVI